MFDISIPLRFDGPQPNAFGAERAAANILGDTRSGSSVNFERYAFSPHCSGTHTECVGHITHERISVRTCLQDAIVPAMVISLEPRSGESEAYSAMAEGDLLITAAAIQAALDRSEFDHRIVLKDGALAIRTLPNGPHKLTAEYTDEKVPAYFSNEAMDLLVGLGIKHLLVDMPSIDRLSDGGVLANHRKFWYVAPGSTELRDDERRGATITELIYVPEEVKDGRYLLNLQIAPFESDAAPSRPVLLPFE